MHPWVREVLAFMQVRLEEYSPAGLPPTQTCFKTGPISNHCVFCMVQGFSRPFVTYQRDVPEIGRSRLIGHACDARGMLFQYDFPGIPDLLQCSVVVGPHDRGVDPFADFPWMGSTPPHQDVVGESTWERLLKDEEIG